MFLVIYLQAQLFDVDSMSMILEMSPGTAMGVALCLGYEILFRLSIDTVDQSSHSHRIQEAKLSLG